jgi:hypothetical protein
LNSEQGDETMSRSGVEAKIPWAKVPLQVRQQVEAAMGSRVCRAARIWGGYGPAPTFRLALENGERAFMKATFKESNEFSRKALDHELRVYRELGGFLARWMPNYYTTIVIEDWHVLLLEDLGPKSVPPWKTPLTRNIVHGIADFHQSTLGRDLPGWLERPHQELASESWERVIRATDDFQLIASWAGDAAPGARAWLQMVTPIISTQMGHPILQTEPFALLHGDIRSDNLRYKRGRLSLFDWPAVTVGRPEWEMVAFAQTVTVEGGMLPEQVMAWYAEEITVDADAVNAAIAWWFCFFAGKAWKDDIPGLPRLRPFQRQQVAVLAHWVARTWSLPTPEWANVMLTPSSK